MKIEAVDLDGNIIDDLEFGDDWASVQFNPDDRFGELAGHGWPIEMLDPSSATFQVREVLAFAWLRLRSGAMTAREQRFLARVMLLLMTAHRIDVSPRGVDRHNAESRGQNATRDAEIRRMDARGESRKGIAKAFGISEQTVYRVLKKRQGRG